MPRRQRVLAVDVGTTKAAALVAEVRSDRDIAVLGIAVTPIAGVKRGLVVEPERASQSVRDAVNRATSMAGFEPVDVAAAVNGDHVHAQVERVSADLRGRSVTDQDLEGLSHRAARQDVESGREAIRVIRGNFELDGLSSVGNPVGLAVQRMTMESLVVSAQTQQLRNLRRTLQMAGLAHPYWVPAGLAAASGALSEDERQLGVVLLDIGGGTTQVMVWRGGLPQLLAVVPVGGDLITSDLAVGLGVVAAQAERLKIERASAIGQADGMVELKSVNGQTMKLVGLDEVSAIVEARLDEWLTLVQDALKTISWTKGPPGGVVLVGGGALLKGIQEWLERVWGWPVRLGAPHGMGGLSDLVKSPGHANVVGLAKIALQDGLGFRRETAWTRLVQGWLRTWS
ncbi:MAG: cell division protein FtsA [Clostridia bacterium]